MPKELMIYAILLLGFIFINVFIYFFIQLKGGEKLFKKLFYYWLSVLLVVLIEGVFVEGKLSLSLSFLVNFLPIAIMSNFLLSMYDYKFKFNFYLKAIPASVLLTIFLNFLDAPFSLVSMPIVLVCSGPLLEGLYVSLVVHRHEKRTSKTLASFLYTAGILCSLYYAFNRYHATEIQFFIGFGSAFVTYIMCSILLPIVCIQMINDKKTDYLESLVKDRTRELSESKQEKEKLLRVLVHDISNPLQAAMFQSGLIKKSISEATKESEQVEKVDKNLKSIKDIITHIREYECVISGMRTPDLNDVYLRECLDEVYELFADRFAAKKVQLLIHNKLHPDTKIRVDKTPFIHSVAANLISNALKFSRPESVVLIMASLKESNIVIEIVDQGIGMSKESLRNLFDIGMSTSRNGTLGESGTGFGMPIVKAYTLMFGGRIEAQSSQQENENGTTISLYLPNVAQNNLGASQTYLQ